jgi:hypothetical protein
MLSPYAPITVRKYALHCGSALTPLARVVPDRRWSGMWRIRWQDGQLSDMANAARCLDAVELICERGPPRRNPKGFRWQIEPVREPHRRSLVSPSSKNDPGGAP